MRCAWQMRVDRVGCGQQLAGAGQLRHIGVVLAHVGFEAQDLVAQPVGFAAVVRETRLASLWTTQEDVGRCAVWTGADLLDKPGQ